MSQNGNDNQPQNGRLAGDCIYAPARAPARSSPSFYVNPVAAASNGHTLAVKCSSWVDCGYEMINNKKGFTAVKSIL